MNRNSAIHAPRYLYDCERCKFSWNCGYTCACVMERALLKGKKLPHPPKKIREKVDKALMERGLMPRYINMVKDRILNSI